MKHIVYPEAHRSLQLLEELRTFFSGFPYVRRVMSFGSLVANSFDRWSDLDLIVVTDTQGHYQDLFTSLRQAKPILYHSPLFVQVEPSGGHILGIAFEDESVFHNLDLNFFSLAEYHSLNSLQRFGQVKELFAATADPTTTFQLKTASLQPLPEEHPVEKRIGNAIHWTKKAVKKVLRGQESVAQLKATSDNLKTVISAYPEDILLPGGNICCLAQTYIRIADYLLDPAQP